MLEANLARNLAHRRLVFGESVSMHEAHRYAPEAGIEDFLKLLPDLLVVRLLQHSYCLTRQAFHKTRA